MLTHDLAIQIKAGAFVLAQSALLNQTVKVLTAFSVNFRCVEIGCRRKIDLGFADMKKAERIAVGNLTGFL